jgi:hypothetical protein
MLNRLYIYIYIYQLELNFGCYEYYFSMYVKGAPNVAHLLCMGK